MRKKTRMREQVSATGVGVPVRNNVAVSAEVNCTLAGLQQASIGSYPQCTATLGNACRLDRHVRVDVRTGFYRTALQPQCVRYDACMQYLWVEMHALLQYL
jgi:hypothetical protein